MLNKPNNCVWVHISRQFLQKSADGAISCLRYRKVPSYRPVDLLKFFNVFMWVRCQHRFIQEALCIGQWTSIHLHNKQKRKQKRLKCCVKVPMKWKIKVLKNRRIWKAFKSEEEWCFLFCHISSRSRDIQDFCIMQIMYWWCPKVWQYGSQNTK